MVVYKVYRNENGGEVKLFEKYGDAAIFVYKYNSKILSNKSISDEKAREISTMTGNAIGTVNNVAITINSMLYSIREVTAY